MEIYPCCKNIPLRAKNIPFLQTQTYRAKNIPLLQKTMTACKNNTFDDFENAITIRKCSIHALAFLGGGLSQDYGRCARMKTRRVSRGGELIHVFALHIHAWRCTFMFFTFSLSKYRLFSFNFQDFRECIFGISGGGRQ